MRLFKLCAVAALAFVSTTGAQAATLTEGFDEPFAGWESRWFGTESNAYNYYVSEYGADNVAYRGHESVTGMFLSDGDSYRDGGNYGEIHIRFNEAFGASLTSFSLDIASALREDLGLAPTLTFFNMQGDAIASFVVPTSPVVTSNWVPQGYTNFSVTSASGIAGFSLSGSAQGSVIVDNLVATTVPEPEAIAMMLAGLGVIGAAARRVRRG
ncbi:PEP-CTERM sorting domain-containing protein [Methyloversatilis thermotolerans]|uniref:PEP-CTERM sorting domain-containing protein n=1 Tax=Methyloversatilis thermotolerans TaxID=1346290 RepID=UPI000372731A|nr:PEP-CTERM sorting domain-containing protein [Methyloversatilis thermotolerans]